MKKSTKQITTVIRRFFSKASSLLLLFQRTPLVQMLFPEAGYLTGAAAANTSALAIATYAGLGAYDSVSGATTPVVYQFAPVLNGTTINATTGVTLNALFKAKATGTGDVGTPESWQVVGALPNGLSLFSSGLIQTNSINGIPTQTGSFPITIKAWEKPGFTGAVGLGTFTIVVAAGNSAPTITTHPASTSINTGTTTVLSVVATGTPAPTYQWYQGTSPSTTIPVGTNSSSFTTPALNIATSYWVKVTNSLGNINSNTAVVSINQPAAIGSHPGSIAINSSQSTVLNVTATGTGPFTYQWYQGNSPSTTTPVGTNSNSFTTPGLTLNTSYWVKVTNVANLAGANSNTAVVSINQPAAIGSHPGSIAINSGQSTVLNVSATGTGPFTYQWYQGNSPSTTTPVGTNSNSFTTPGLSLNTSYWVKVTNVANSAGANSNTAVVSIIAPYDAWKTFRFTPAQLAIPLFSGPTADPDGDGASNDSEYVFGTVPTQSETSFNPVLTKTATQFTLAFTALGATGTGYAGKTRHYAIESAADPSQAVWPLVAGYEDIVATGQNVSYTAPITPGRKIFRLKVWLTP